MDDPLLVVLVPFALLKAALFVVIAWWVLRSPPGDPGGEGGDGGTPERPRPGRGPSRRRARLAWGPHGSATRRPHRPGRPERRRVARR